MPVKDDSLVAQYIRAIENPDSVGYRDGRWYQPDLPGYDRNNRGFGVDVVYNTDANALTKNRKDKWLTEDEERKIRNEHINRSIGILEKKAPSYILRNPPSEEKQAMAVGMLYRGDSVMQNPTIREAYLSGSEEDMQRAVSDYYQSKRVSERAQRHNQFFNPNQSNTKKSNVPISIRRPVPYTSPGYKKEQFIPGKKYDDGGYLTYDWDSLSMQDKAEMMKVAIDNGITTLPEIRRAYNEFAKGGYKPSAQLQKDIATWEGSEMKRNRPFEEVTQQFNAVVSKEVQDRLQPKQLDALYSYGYNVGMGNLKKRVMPMLNAYVNGKVSNEDVQKSMWASKDSQLRGLAKRRNWERNMFGGGYYAPFSKDVSKKGMRNYKVSDLGLSQQFYDGISDSIAISQMQVPTMDVDPTTLYKAPTIDDTLFTAPKVDKQEIAYSPQQDRLEGLRRYNTIMGMMGENIPFGNLIGSSNEPGILSYVNAIYS